MSEAQEITNKKKMQRGTEHATSAQAGFTSKWSLEMLVLHAGGRKTGEPEEPS